MDLNLKKLMTGVLAVTSLLTGSGCEKDVEPTPTRTREVQKEKVLKIDEISLEPDDFYMTVLGDTYAHGQVHGTPNEAGPFTLTVDRDQAKPDYSNTFVSKDTIDPKPTAYGTDYLEETGKLGLTLASKDHIFMEVTKKPGEANDTTYYNSATLDVRRVAVFRSYKKELLDNKNFNVSMNLHLNNFETQHANQVTRTLTVIPR